MIQISLAITCDSLDRILSAIQFTEKLLLEYLDTDLLTTFTVQPIDAEQSQVTIESIWQPEPGLSGVVDRFTTPFFMRRIYRQELDILDEYAQQQRKETR